MNVGSISGVSQQILESSKTVTSSNGSFEGLFQSLIDNVNQTDNVVQEDIVKIASGQADDLHSVMINAEKAQLALELLTQVRNKAIDAYNEIMKISI